jgi:hypothetical protein
MKLRTSHSVTHESLLPFEDCPREGADGSNSFWRLFGLKHPMALNSVDSDREHVNETVVFGVFRAHRSEIVMKCQDSRAKALTPVMRVVTPPIAVVICQQFLLKILGYDKPGHIACVTKKAQLGLYEATELFDRKASEPAPCSLRVDPP